MSLQSFHGAVADWYAADDRERSDQSTKLDRYLSTAIRDFIEQNYYEEVRRRAHLDVLAGDPGFLHSPLDHVALYSDHGPVHARNVALNILAVLDAVHGVLIPKRDNVRIEFMKGYGVMLAYCHDMGMKNFSSLGRTMHPEYAAQEVFGRPWNSIIDRIWDENWGNVAWRLVNLPTLGSLQHDRKIVLRELLSMSVGHSKSKVPIDVLNDPVVLQQVMVRTLSTELNHLYHEQGIEKARNASNPVPPEASSLPTGGHADHHKETHQELREKYETFRRENPHLRKTNDDVYFRYSDFDRDAFRWLVSEQKENRELASDVIDTIRALRAADALRQRGTTLKTSASYQILVDQSTANAVFALQTGSGETFLLESTNPISAGEANIASSELTRQGDLRISFHRGAFSDQETARRGARNAAGIIDDIQRDVIATFQRAAGDMAEVKDTHAIGILIENAEDSITFADLVLSELLSKNPALLKRSRTVPSMTNVDPEERARYLSAEPITWTVEKRRQIIARIGQGGHVTTNVDPDSAFSDTRLATVSKDDTLIRAGAPPGFVYVPMEVGLTSIPLGGYLSFPIKAWVPVGNTRVIRGAVQESKVVAERDVKLLVIPRESYLKCWHSTYTSGEFSEMLPLLYAEERSKGIGEILEILKQMAMIDAVLDERESRFIAEFARAYEIPFDPIEFRRDLESRGRTDFVALRQSVVAYLALQPSSSQVIRLQDMLSGLVKVDNVVPEEERLILPELEGLLRSYLDAEGVRPSYRLLIVPQNAEQDQAMASLFPAYTRRIAAGGIAYIGGEFYSREYADMICERYRALNFFTVVNDECMGEEMVSLGARELTAPAGSRQL